MTLRNLRSSKEADRRIPTEWIHGLSEEDKIALEELWRNSSAILEPLKKIITKYVDQNLTDLTTDYDNPNWAYRRADKNGQIIAYTRILKLLP